MTVKKKGKTKRELREVRKGFRLSEKENKRFVAALKKSKLTQSEFVRDAIEMKIGTMTAKFFPGCTSIKPVNIN